ncbi:MAG: glycoside hydrolase family 125 protein, partial [Candidatus Eremiobacteraeota bacterium]|nr:glycoside hydrolase family 125 protein [Candidatus Eremiobacteraeota bacterium]
MTAVGFTTVPGRASGAIAVSPTVDRLYLTAFDEAISRHAREEPDGTTYVSTGDIRAMWLRDSAAVVLPYISLSTSDPDIARMLR